MAGQSSSSPSNSPEQPGTQFPRFTLKDMVASQFRLLEVLGIKELFCVIAIGFGKPSVMCADGTP